MENVFEELVASSTDTANTQTSENTISTGSNQELDSSFDLDLGDAELGESDETETDAGDSEEESDVSNIVGAQDNELSNNAFAQMRVQNKELSSKLKELDSIAKAAGLKDVDELITKSKEAQVRQQAKKQGIPEEVARELADFKDFMNETRREKEEQMALMKEQTFVNNLQDYIASNKLSKESVQKLSDDLVKDGFTNDQLMDLPKNALNRILNSYTGASVQENLKKKDAIRNELPLNQSSKIDTESLKKDIDDFAKFLAGKN